MASGSNSSRNASPKVTFAEGLKKTNSPGQEKVDYSIWNDRVAAEKRAILDEKIFEFAFLCKLVHICYS